MLWKSEYICKKDQVHKTRAFLPRDLQIPIIVQLVKSAPPRTELPTVPCVLHSRHCRVRHNGNRIQPFQSRAFQAIMCVSSSRFCFSLLHLHCCARTLQYWCWAPSFSMLCKKASQSNQSKSISALLTVFYRLYFSFFFFFTWLAEYHNPFGHSWVILI